MLAIIIAISFIVLGIIFIIIKKKGKPQLDAVTQAEKKKSENPEESKEKKLFEAAYKLEDLEAPSNFPSEIVFYFGSQTGTAEKFCQILDEEANKIKGIQSSRVIDFEDFKPELFTQHQLVVVCIATHYEGDPCDNTKKIYKWIRE